MLEIDEFEVRPGGIDGVLIASVKTITDERGSIREAFRRSAFDDAAIGLGPIAQLNLTESRRGAIRGMHAEQMAKLVTVAAGTVHAAFIDLRPDSATYGVVDRVTISVGTQVFVPPGVANGFQTLTETSQYLYCFDTEWRPGMPGRSCAPIDDAVDFGWPLPVDPDDPAMLSAKDRTAPRFSELEASP